MADPLLPASGPGQDERDALRRRSRRAGPRILLALLVGVVAHIAGLVLVVGPVSTVLVAVRPYLAVQTVVGLVLPVPPGGFAWSAVRAALRERDTARTRFDADDPWPFVLQLALYAVFMIPCLLVQTSLRELGLRLGAELGLDLLVLVLFVAVPLGIVDVRRRRAVRRSGSR